MLEWTGERYVPWFEGAEIGYEHLHRYAFVTQFVRNKRVLDLASGEGYGSNMLARTAKNVVGVDLDEQSIQHARNKYIRANLEFKTGSIMDVPIAGQSLFDVVVCFEALEHVDDHEKLLAEARRLLVPDGLFFVSTPNKTVYTDDAHFQNPFHVHEVYFDEFQAELERHFRQVKILGQRIYCNSNIWPIFPEEHPQPSEFVIERTSQEFALVGPDKRVPIYFVAIASNRSQTLSGYLSVLIDVSNALTGDRDQTIVRLSGERDDLRNQSSRLDQELAKAEDRIAQAQHRIAQAQDRIGRLNEIVKRRDQLLENQDRHIGELMRVFHEKEARFNQDTEWLQSVVADYKKKVAGREQDIVFLQQQLSAQIAILNGIHASRGWRVLASCYRLRDRWLPEGSFRRNFTAALFRLLLSFRSLVTPGRSVSLPAAQITQPEPAAPPAQETPKVDEAVVAQPPPPPVPFELPAPTTEEEIQNYQALSERISKLRRTELENIHVNRPDLISIAEADVTSSAESISFPSENDVQVSIIIPAFNKLTFTLECLTSVMRNSSAVAYEVIVVDDASTDRTQEVLPSIRNLTCLRNPKNLGFVYTCNRGAQAARGRYLLFLNNDAQVTENWLKPLVDTFHDYKNVGAVGPKIVFPNGRLQEAGALVNRDGTSRLIGFYDSPDRARYSYVREVMYCSGGCLLVDAEAFRDLKGFDTSLAPAYCEDWDLAFKLRERGLRVLYNPGAVVIHHLSVTSNDIDPGFKISCVVRNQQKLAMKWQRAIDDLNNIRLIAWYLPQFHPIPENDRWWGKGFTDWTNVVKARPNYAGHYQPHLPADLGFYDLRVEEVVDHQVELAKRYGLYGFCYFYYWFAGKRLLERPLDRMLEARGTHNRFCMAWANENWTRTWDGLDQEILIGQNHSDDDDRAVIRDMMRYLQHPDYIRINGKPLLLVYRISLFTGIQRTTDIWREECLREGLGEIYLSLVESFEAAGTPVDPVAFGFDGSVEFPPHRMGAPMTPEIMVNLDYTGSVHDYREAALKYVQAEVPNFVRFRSVMPSWDNTPRRQDRSHIFEHARPGSYQAWLEAILDQTHEQNFGDERIVFINAWNEWGEGNHLEPDKRFGHGFLEATRNALDASLLRRDKVAAG